MAEQNKSMMDDAKTENEQLLAEYHLQIKKRLQAWRENLRNEQSLDLDFNALQIIMSKYNIPTTQQKLRAMFDDSNTQKDRKIPLAEMIALCQILKLPIYDICALPDLSESVSNTPWFKPVRGSKPKTTAYILCRIPTITMTTTAITSRPGTIPAPAWTESIWPRASR